jgi:hypothetical protein
MLSRMSQYRARQAATMGVLPWPCLDAWSRTPGPGSAPCVAEHTAGHCSRGASCDRRPSQPAGIAGIKALVDGALILTCPPRRFSRQPPNYSADNRGVKRIFCLCRRPFWTNPIGSTNLTRYRVLHGLRVRFRDTKSGDSVTRPPGGAEWSWSCHASVGSITNTSGERREPIG